MKLYNQTNKHLRWDPAGHEFTWEPYGSCVLPDDLAKHAEAQGLPVKLTPVSPESRATAAVLSGQEQARADRIVSLERALKDAKAEAASTANELQQANGRISKLEHELGVADGKLVESQERVEKLRGDLAAAERLLNEKGAAVEAQKPSKPEDKSKRT